MATAFPSTALSINFTRDPRLFSRDHNRHMRHAFEAGAEYHFQHHVPRHFQGFAAAKYGYYPRTQKYNDRKLKQVGHLDPLVFTGASKRRATGSHLPIQATPKGATLTVQLAIDKASGRLLDAAAAARLFAAGKRKTATISNKQLQNQVQILRRVTELQAISQDEINTVGRKIAEDYTNQANSQSQPYRVRVKLN